MSSIVIITIIVFLISFAFFYIRRILLHASGDTIDNSNEKKRDITLQILSKLWSESRRGKNFVISLEKLSYIWREEQAVQVAEDRQIKNEKLKNEQVKDNPVVEDKQILKDKQIKKDEQKDKQQQTVKDNPVAKNQIKSEQTKNIQQEQIQFTHNRLQEFYDKYIRNNNIIFKGNNRKVIMSILKLLDENGDCPSVVQRYKNEDSDYEMSNKEYDILAQITLLDHSVDTAEEMLKLYGNSIGLMTPKIFIATLAHDIGKIPSYHKSNYVTGDHPIISVQILSSIEGYNELPYKDEIKQAILMHHKSPKNDFDQNLKEADGRARRKEIAEAEQKEILEISKKPQQQKADGKQGDSIEVTKQQETPKPKPIINRQPNKDYQSNLYYQKPSGEDKIREVDVSWLNPDELISVIKPYINKIVGGFFYAFSMKNGYVYVQAGLMEEKIKKLGSKAMDQTTKDMGGDKSLRRSVILSVVNILREKGVIAEGLIKKGYFGGRFRINMKNGKALETFFIPFNAEAFCDNVSELEAKKEGKIREIESVEIIGNKKDV